MAISYYVVMFGFGLILLVWGSNLFVDSAILLANYFHIPEILIGATIVSLGTTLPEATFSTMASLQGFSDMALGNALGSILCNTGFIAAVMLILRPIRLSRQTTENIISGACFLWAGFLVYIISGIFSGGLTRLSGMILLGLCVLFLLNIVRSAKKEEKEQIRAAERPALKISEIIKIPLEAAAIYIGADVLVKYGPKLAGVLGIPELIISLTFVALGTSLPELVTSLTALKKKHSAISLGNIIGADILNFVLVGGLSSIICPITYPANILTREFPFIFYLLFLLCIPSVLRKSAGRIQGIFMLGGYALYLVLTVTC